MRKIFTLLAAFLAIAGSAVWGQNTHKVSVRSDSRNIKYEGPTEVKDGETFSFTISGVDGYGEAKFRMTSYSLAMKDEEGNWIDIEHTHSNDWWNLPVTFTVTDTGVEQHVYMYDELMPVAKKVKTGDNSNIMSYAFFGLISLIGLLKTRKQEDKE